jgi:hypothetical protein
MASRSAEKSFRQRFQSYSKIVAPGFGRPPLVEDAVDHPAGAKSEGSWAGQTLG